MSAASDQNTYDPYRIDSPQEIDQLLLQILKQGVLLRMHNGNINNAVITTLVDIDFDTNSLIIDSAAQQTINEQLLNSERAFFEALVNQVSIEFQVQPLSATTHDGRAALMGPIPLFLRRIQRRDSFRIRPKGSTAASCTLNTKTTPVTLPVFDISSGGVAISDELSVLNAYKGRIFPDCLLTLPGVGEVTVDLQVVRQQTQTLASGKKLERFGCSFFSIKAPEQIRIQNYINQEERSQIARDRGLA